MKTDRFDEEFRRKLLGLPVEADPGEVERIESFVHANKPALPNLGWGKLLLYGGSSLLLIVSLSYNLIQNYRNTRLQSSIDSLAHQSVGQTMPREVIRHDTVYIAKSSKTERIEAISKPTIASKIEPLKQANSSQSDKTGRNGSVAMGNSKSTRLDNEARLSLSAVSFPRSSLRSTTSGVTIKLVAPNQPGENSGQRRAKPDRVAAPSLSSNRLLIEKIIPASESDGINKPAPTEVERTEQVYSNASLPTTTQSKTRRENKGRPTIFSFDSNGQLVKNQSSKQHQKTFSDPPPAGFTPTSTDNANSSEVVPELNRLAIPAEPLASRQATTTSNQLAIISPSHPLVVPKNGLSARTPRRSWHLTMPDLSVPNVQYRIGGGLSGGNDQVGGALLGELMLNHHWSIQAGLQLTGSQGFYYRDEQDFNEHQKENFRQTYASQVPLSSIIQDIQQMTLLVQVPIQVAYHLPLGRQWGVRLGLGTELNLWEHSAVSFNYRENNRSTKHELSPSRDHVPIVNNLILTMAVERSWKKWLIRAGPFINPQLRPVGYKPDGLPWGANLQVFYRLEK